MGFKSGLSRISSSKSLDEWIVSSRSIQDPALGFVEALYQTCSTTLADLWKTKFKLTLHGPQRNTMKQDVAQLHLWGNNFPSSHLDTILERSTCLRMDVIDKLYRIGRILSQYCEGITVKPHGEETPTDPMEELATLLEKAAIILRDAEDADCSSDSDTESDGSSVAESERNQFGRLHCYISCLMDLGPTIEQHIANLLYKKDEQIPPRENVFSLSHSAQPFAMRIKDRFSDAQIALVERLAEANWERSVRIRTQVEQGDPDDEPESTPGYALTLFKPFSVFHDSGLGTSVPARSQYAATVASHTSFLSLVGEESQGRLRVPPLPYEGRDGRMFQCTYCKKHIQCKNRIEWKIHVFADLQPYICTHTGCSESWKTFSSRKAWGDHEFNTHFSQLHWRCFICRYMALTSEQLITHLQTDHDIKLSKRELERHISHTQVTSLNDKFKVRSCPLCLQSDWPSVKTYSTHIGRHLEEISLASLPNLDDEDSDSHPDSSKKSDKVAAQNGSGRGAASSTNSEASHPDSVAPVLRDGLTSKLPVDPSESDWTEMERLYGEKIAVHNGEVTVPVIQEGAAETPMPDDLSQTKQSKTAHDEINHRQNMRQPTNFEQELNRRDIPADLPPQSQDADLAKVSDDHPNSHPNDRDSTERPYHCDVEGCSISGMGFANENALKAHERSFHAEKYVQETFASPHRKRVEKTHWQCPLCSKRFARNQILKDHLRSHNGERPHQCGECNKAFTRKSDMKRHEKTHERRR